MCTYALAVNVGHVHVLLHRHIKGEFKHTVLMQGAPSWFNLAADVEGVAWHQHRGMHRRLAARCQAACAASVQQAACAARVQQAACAARVQQAACAARVQQAACAASVQLVCNRRLAARCQAACAARVQQVCRCLEESNTFPG